MNVDPSGRFTIFQLFVVLLFIAFALWLIVPSNNSTSNTSSSGLQNSSIPLSDIEDAIDGFEKAKGILIKVAKDQPLPQDWPEYKSRLNDKGVYIVGQMGEGVVGVGENLSYGQQEIVNYFEALGWNIDNPEARTHPNATDYVKDKESWIVIWGTAEAKRLEIVVEELEKEKERRESN